MPLWSDLRYGLRMMRRAPSFSLIVIATLALGIGVNTAIFSVVHAVLLQPLPYPDSERLVWLGESTGEATGISVTWPNFVQWRDQNHSFERLSAFQFTNHTLTGRDEPRVTRGMEVTADYLPLLGARPLLGRLLDAKDDPPGAAPALVLNHRFWSDALGGDPSIVGKTLTLDGDGYEVIGVAAPLWQTAKVDYYVSLGRAAGSIVDRSRHGSIRALGLLRPNVPLSAAIADLDGIMKRLATIDPGPENEHHSFSAFLTEQITGHVRTTLLVLLGAATLVLLIACANVASLLLARGTTRVHELALRAAIGAGRGRLVGQLLTETLLIAIAGGAAGVVLAFWTQQLLITLGPTQIPRLTDMTLDVPVLLFACAVTLATGLIAGVAPAISACRIDLNLALKDAARSVAGDRRQIARGALVIAEIALTLMLVFASGLLLRSLAAAQYANPGVDATHVLSVDLLLPKSTYASPEAIESFQTRLTTELRAVPGVLEVGTVLCPAGAGDCGDWFYSILGRPAPARNEVPVSLFNTADTTYFHTMRIPLRQGRPFDDTDRLTTSPVAIVNETFARRWWPNESAIGQQIKVGGPYVEGETLEIVGVAGDVKQFGLDAQVEPEIYRPFTQKRGPAMSIMLRTASTPDAIGPAVRHTISTIDRNLPVQRMRPLEDALGASLTRRRFTTLLLTAFATLAIALAAVGIYGLLSYWVGVRKQEIAIRLALGAHPSTIMRWTTTHALRLALIGIALGTLASWLTAKGLEDLVYGVTTQSPMTLLLAAVIVLLLAAAATIIPSRRAARLDTMSQLYHS